MTIPSDQPGANAPDESLLVAKLTAKERECLKRWLNHETAKQIALSLDVSHHAIEKRLKSARAKLGVNTSLDAARMLERAEAQRPTHVIAERYQRVAVRSPDMARQAPVAESSRSKNRKIGASIMAITLTVALAVALNSNSLAVPDELDVVSHANGAAPTSQSAVDQEAGRRTVLLSSDDLKYDPATETEIRDWLGWIFRTTDQDGSGFLDREEAPQTFPIDDALGQIIISEESAQTAFMDEYDGDSDGRVTQKEFVDASIDSFKDKGIPKLPTEFKPVRQP